MLKQYGLGAMCALLCLSWSCVGFAAAKKVAIPALATAMQERYAQIQTFRAPFTQKLIHKESGAEDVRQGVLSFQRPLRIRWETKSPEPELLVVTEKEIWNYLPKDKTAARYAPDLAKDSRSIIQVITGQSRLDQNFTVAESGREGELVILSLFPNEPTMQFTEGKLWVNTKTKFIHRAAVTDFYGNINDITLSDMATNLAFEADVFSFSPPAGVRIDDQMQAGASGNPLLR